MGLPHLMLLATVAMLLLPGVPFAGYTENLTVQVVDQAFRPVAGAQAYVEYELNSVKGKVKTKPKATGQDGLANILFTDYEEIQSQTDYSYTLFVKYGDRLLSATLIAGEGANATHMARRTHTMHVESYIAYLRVIDQAGKPLPATVVIGTEKKETGQGGSASFALPPGSYDVEVERDDLAKVLPLAINSSTGDRSLDVVLSYYSLNVKVQDDYRNPLMAEVDVNGVRRQTDSWGVAHFDNITTDSPQVVAMYGQVIKRIQPKLLGLPELEITFDTNKPRIRDQVSSLSASGVGTVRFFVDDAGPGASGIDTVSVSYSAGGAQTPVSVYAVGYGTYEAKIPAQAVGTLVKYQISVADKEGNKATGSGEYVIAPAGASNVPGDEPQQAPPSQQMPNETIFVGIVAVAIVAFGAIYYFNKRQSGRIEPPVLPPQMPRQ